MRCKRNTLPSVLLAILSALGILVGLLIVGLSIAGAFYLKNDTLTLSPPDGFSIFTISFLALATCIINFFTLSASLKYIRKKPGIRLRNPKYFVFLIVGFLWIISLIAGYFTSGKSNLFLVFAFITTLAVIFPVWLLVMLARSGLPRSTFQRELGTLTIGLLISPMIIITLEIIAIIIIGVGVVFALGLRNQFPVQLIEVFTSLSASSNGLEGVENALIDLMRDPLIAAAAFLALGLVAPMIEEIFKPMALWLLLNRPLRDDEGYTLGLISGGAFALLESAGMIIQISPENWLTAVILRSGTGVLHIGLSGLVGFGLASSKRLRKPGRGISFVLLAGGLHGLWNSLALFSGLASFPAMDTIGGNQINMGSIIAITLMGLVFVFVIILNIFINRYLRRQQIFQPLTGNLR